jgi:hypothetical protein
VLPDSEGINRGSEAIQDARRRTVEVLMKKILLGALCLMAPSFSIAQVMVQVSSPQAYATIAAPTHVHATASSSQAITGWHVYLDNADVYTGPAGGTIDTDLNASQGTHQLVIRAWDTTGEFGSQALQATVTGAAAPVTTAPAPAVPPTTALPTPPSTATVFSNIEQMTSGWAACNTAACAGGSGAGAYWQAFDSQPLHSAGAAWSFIKTVAGATPSGIARWAPTTLRRISCGTFMCSLTAPL